jgi:predicted nucleic acid-binding protein
LNSARVCLDASFMLTLAFEDAHWEEASSWMDQAFHDAYEYFVPPLFYAEITSAVRRRVFAKRISPADGALFLDKLLAWPAIVSQEDNSTFQRSAYRLATRFNQPRAYDAQYLALADLLGCQLWTADERLYNNVRRQLPWVRWIGAAA